MLFFRRQMGIRVYARTIGDIVVSLAAAIDLHDAPQQEAAMFGVTG